MAQLTQTGIQKELNRLRSEIKSTSAGGVVLADGIPVIRGNETDGDAYVDTRTHITYTFSDGEWIPTGTGIIVPTVIDTTAVPGEPINLSVLEELYETNQASGVKSRVIFSWANIPASEIIQATARNIVEFKLSSDTVWTNHGTFNTDRVIIADLDVGVYDFRVTALTTFDVAAATVEITGQVVQGLNKLPSDPTGFVVNPTGGSALLRWDLPTANQDLDVLSGGHVQIRHSAITDASVSWAEAQVIVESIAGSTNFVTVPLLTGTYLCKFIDTTNNESLNAAIIVNSFAALGFNFIATQPQEPTFAGDKVGCSVVGGKLRMDEGVTTMSYDFAGVVDLGSVQSVRVNPQFTANTVDPSDTICNVISDFCDLLVVCTRDITAEIKFFIGVTDDSPFTDDGTCGTDGATNTTRALCEAAGGSWKINNTLNQETVYTPYRELITRDLATRAMRFRMTASTTVAGVVEFSKLDIGVDAPDVIQTGTGATSSTGDTTITFPREFYTGISGSLLPRVGVTVLDLDEGDFVKITDRTKTGFKIAVFDNSSPSVRIVKLFDWQAIGI